MARGKPTLFSRPAGSAPRAERKRAAESYFEGGEALPHNPPAELAGAKAGRAAWRRLLRAFDELPNPLLSSLDRSSVVEFCLAVEARAKAQLLEADIYKKYQAGEVTLQDLIRARAELRMSQRLISDLGRALYLSPKARAGVTPEAKEPTAEQVIENELAELDRMLEFENR